MMFDYEVGFLVAVRMLIQLMAVGSGPAGPVLAGPVFTVIFGTAHVQIMKFSY